MSSSQAERTEATLEKGKTQKLIMEGEKNKPKGVSSEMPLRRVEREEGGLRPSERV